jgi:hypothetical protein
MYIIKKENKQYALSNKAIGDIYAEILPATIVLDGEEIKAKIVSTEEKVLISAVEGLEFKDTYNFESANRILVTRTITNTTDKRIRFKSIFELKDGFKAENYVFPGFNYNGNQFGGSNTPTGLTRNGKPWVFAYDRQGIPSCTVTEDENHGVATFVSDVDEVSLRSSSSLIKDEEGYMYHRIFHPVSEMPYTYGGKNMMLDPYEEYMFLVPGGKVTLYMYIYVCVPKYKNFAMANLMEECNEIFPMKKTPCLSLERIWDLGIAFFKNQIMDCHGTPMISGHLSDKLFSMSHSGALHGEKMRVARENPENTYLSTYATRFEIGWADQGAMVARLMVIDAFKRDDKELLDIATKILDGYVSTQWENGLLYPFYSHNFIENPEKRTLPDSCNMGWAMAELVRSYHLYKEHGINKPEYLEFSRKLAEFAVSHYSDEFGFGKIWNVDGSPRKVEGGAGGFMIMGLMEVYKTIKDKRYLETVIKAMNFYHERDLGNFVCTAGALDCLCVDKETVYPFFKVAIDLYEETEEPLWLERAQMGAYYFFSWMFWYDALYPHDAEFTKYGYYTTGGTLISAEHSAIDPWGALLVTDMIKLSQLTGNDAFKQWARMTWCNALLGITTEKGMSVHGNVRPLGSQNEGFFHCRWTKYRPTCEERGHFNDNLQTWMSAWRLYTIATLPQEDHGYLI